MELPSCALCRKRIDPGTGTTFAAAGRALFCVHREPCAAYIRTGVGLLGLAAFKGLHMVLARKAPLVLQVVERAAQLRG